MFEYAKPEQKKKSKDIIQKKENKKSVVSPNITGIPDEMKTQFENLSGFSFDDVRVHYNSDKPAYLQALAYTQGNQVFVGQGQEKHLRHELGHIVQQKKGDIKATSIYQGKKINYNLLKEQEADIISKQSEIDVKTNFDVAMPNRPYNNNNNTREIVQAYWSEDFPMTEESIQWVMNFVSRIERLTFRERVKDDIFSKYYVGQQNYGQFIDGKFGIVQHESFYCHNCGLVLPRGNLQVGHIMNWRNYLILKGVCSLKEARDMYNDPDNLRIECQKCNSSHKYELEEQHARIQYKQAILNELGDGIYIRVQGLNREMLIKVIYDILFNVDPFTIDTISDYISNNATTGLDLDVNASNILSYELREAMLCFLNCYIVRIN